MRATTRGIRPSPCDSGARPSIPTVNRSVYGHPMHSGIHADVASVPTRPREGRRKDELRSPGANSDSSPSDNSNYSDTPGRTERATRRKENVRWRRRSPYAWWSARSSNRETSPCASEYRMHRRLITQQVQFSGRWRGSRFSFVVASSSQPTGRKERAPSPGVDAKMRRKEMASPMRRFTLLLPSDPASDAVDIPSCRPPAYRIYRAAPALPLHFQ